MVSEIKKHIKAKNYTLYNIHSFMIYLLENLTSPLVLSFISASWKALSTSEKLRMLERTALGDRMRKQ